MEATSKLPLIYLWGHSTDQQDLRRGTFIDCHHILISIIATRGSRVEAGGVTQPV